MAEILSIEQVADLKRPHLVGKKHVLDKVLLWKRPRSINILLIPSP